MDDSQQIRTASRAVGRMADDARRARRAAASADHVHWQGASAQRYRQRLSERARELGHCADELDELKDRLDAHARAVERHEHTAKEALLRAPVLPGVLSVRDVLGVP
ncbi:hypothetical protein [Luteipulveratus mongoliensis]|uniref:Uncharacterized protein n=1 Tax=Luteipulveratus mongoliensis TaxID=571913 RepID=A0A0K1JNZ6_9MICO|nr:hypothetical protein [Luteipulveratus mongoliensis]AKU18308.1 hypothetical protein VV02_24790 [Luteipulveratus mongoliensis]